MEVLGVTHHLLGATGDGRAPRPTATRGWRAHAAAAHPRAWAGADLADAAAAVRAVLDDVRPDVVVTYDATGGYGHPDHVRTHEATCRAVATSADAPVLYAVLTPLSWAVEDRGGWPSTCPPTAASSCRATTTPSRRQVVPDAVVTHTVVDPSVVPGAVAGAAVRTRRRSWWATGGMPCPTTSCPVSPAGRATPGSTRRPAGRPVRDPP